MLETENILMSHSAAGQNSVPERLHIHSFVGPEEILPLTHVLSGLATRTGQMEAAADLRYYFGKAGLLDRRALLLLFATEPIHASAEIPLSRIVGAVILFELRVLGVATGIFTSNERSGRRTVLAAPEHRLPLARITAAHLLKRKAHTIRLSTRTPFGSELPKGPFFELSGASCRVTSRCSPDYLALQSTLEDTLVQFGHRTRKHMRYYRRRAEEQLGCCFHADAKVTMQELLELNRSSVYPVSSRLAAWRLDVLRTFERPLLLGLRSREGQWMALLAGRRLQQHVEIFWLMNRARLRGHSLSLAHWSFLLEHEISLGTERIYVDGGTGHSLHHAFVQAAVTDLTASRPTLLSFAARHLTRRGAPWAHRELRLFKQR